MIDIVVFGKPRAFESYEFEFDGSLGHILENSHREPFIKPTDYDVPVFHYYKKDEAVIWELYRRCRGYDSDRDGIVLGVGIKSDRDFDLMGTLSRLLIPFWEDFANAFLDSNKSFKVDSIVGRIKGTKWSHEEKEKVINCVKNDAPTPIEHDESLLLLVVPDFADISKIEKNIKAYSDVYITGSASLFQNEINRTVLAKQANNEIHIVKEGKIEKLQDSKSDDRGAKEENGKRGKWTWIWGGKGENESSEKGPDGGKTKPKLPAKLVAAVAVIILFAAAYLLFWPKSKPADKIELAQAPESGYITDGFNLSPKMFHGKSEKTSTKLEDITWRIEGEGEKYIEFDTAHTLLKINDKYRNDKPRTESSFTVIARLDGKELAREQYKLEEYKWPKANKVTMKPYLSPIKQSFPINPILSNNDNTDVSTTLNEITFTVQPSGITHVDKNNNLIVDNRPDNDTQVTVIAYLDNQPISQQTYTIAKKDETTGAPTQQKGVIYYKIGTNDWAPLSSNSTITERNLSNNAKFEARDKNNTPLSGGKWSFTHKIYIGSIEINPTKIDEIRESGRATLTYKINNESVATITFNVLKSD